MLLKLVWKTLPNVAAAQIAERVIGEGSRAANAAPSQASIICSNGSRERW